MRLKLWQVDAFADRPFGGNPAALVPLKSWLDARLMQRIANENNLSETAFLVPRSALHYELRWFTPQSEVDLCGHATLAAAWLIFHVLAPGLKRVAFETRSGPLTVCRGEDGLLAMTLPADTVAPFGAAGLAKRLGHALGCAPPAEILKGRYLMAVWEDAATIRGLKGAGDTSCVLADAGTWGLIVTAPGDQDYDFVSRFFAPAMGVAEDPVCGSAHCALTPFWAQRLGKKRLHAYQASARGGTLLCTDEGATVRIAGKCALYLTGEIEA
jgi:PhzF family phenazine biosynthesis protein